MLPIDGRIEMNDRCGPPLLNARLKCYDVTTSYDNYPNDIATLLGAYESIPRIKLS